MPLVRLHRTADHDLIRELDALCLPEDAPMAQDTLDHSLWWVGRLEGTGEPVAYAGLYTGMESEAWLVRAGVLPVARGCGLQRRLIGVRLRAARAAGYGKVATYTVAYNVRSQRSLIHCGFLPDREEDGCLYFSRSV